MNSAMWFVAGGLAVIVIEVVAYAVMVWCGKALAEKQHGKEREE